jgi:hypothetical protein
LRGLTGTLNSVRLKELCHRCSNLHDVRLQRKVPRVKHLHLGIGNVFSERFRPCGNEERIVFAPNCQQRRLRLAYRDECAPMGKISCTRLFGEERANVASRTNGSPSPARLIAIRSSGRQERQRHFSQMAWINKLPATSTIWKPPSKPRMARDSSKGAHQPHLRRSD